MVRWPVLEIESERRRLEVLRYLDNVPAYRAAISLVRARCNAEGVPTTHDQIAATAQWLSDHGLAEIEMRPEDPVLRITRAGRDAAQGVRRHPGIMRPEPEDRP